ncbi:hypothetical protein BDW60DRAFT_182428 [Aspergillus nidulans var. acristatus]
MRTILGFIPLASMWLSVRRQTPVQTSRRAKRYYTCTFKPTSTFYRCCLEYSDSRRPGHP